MADDLSVSHADSFDRGAGEVRGAMTCAVLRQALLTPYAALCRVLHIPVWFWRGAWYNINHEPASAYHATQGCDELARLVAALPGDTTSILDVGANCGVFAGMCRKRFPNATIYCMEPQAELMPYIKRNCRDAVIWTCAAGAADCCGMLWTGHVSKQSSSFFSDSVYGGIKTGRKVPVSRIDDLLHGQGVDVIKMDIQGGEVAALAGAKETLKTCRLLIVEASFMFPDVVLAVCDLMKDHPYKILGPVSHGADVAVFLGANM